MTATLSLGDLHRANARYRARAPAVVDESGRSLTHREYLSRCLKLADACHRRGVIHQDRVAILAMNGIPIAEFYGACEVAGFIAMTLNYRLAPAELVPLIEDARPKVLLFEAAFAAHIEAIRAANGANIVYVCLDDPSVSAEDYEAFLASGDESGPPFRSSPEDVAHLIYTSGTTGKPKGCMLGHRESVAKAQLHAGDMGVTPQDRFLVVMPLFHVGARGIMSAAQWRGATAYIQRAFDPSRYLEQLERERITIGHLAPTMIQDVLECRDAETCDVSSLRVMCYSAAPMPLPLLKHGISLWGDVFHQSYGQTEGAVTALLRCQHRPDGDEADLRRLKSVGQPIPETEVRIVGDDGRDCACGEAGEILYRGSVMFRGYWNDHVRTAETIKDGWIRSGDMGVMDEDGFVYIVDRKKDMIISGGENIYSREVEDAILKHEAVAEVAVIGVPHPRWGETVRAVVRLRSGASASAEEIIEHCRSLIASYKKPTSVHFAALPKLANGKVDKVAIRQAHSD